MVGSMTDQEWEGRIHILIVRKVGDPEFDGLRPLEDYDIIHQPTLMGCSMERRKLYGEIEVDAYTCDVGWQMDQDGDLAFNLRYSGQAVTEPGVYLVRGWGRKYYVWDMGADEYDAGIGVVPEDEIEEGEPIPPMPSEARRCSYGLP